MRIELPEYYEYTPTVHQIAEEIWELDAEQQLELLLELAKIDTSYRIMMQMQSMRDFNLESDKNYSAATDFVYRLNEYMNGED